MYDTWKCQRYKQKSVVGWQVIDKVEQMNSTMGKDRNTKQETLNSDLISFNAKKTINNMNTIDITIVYQYQRYYIIYPKHKLQLQ